MAERSGSPSRLSTSGPEPFDACPDGARCWHGCPLIPGSTEGIGLPCWRVSAAAPLTEYGDDWTPEDKERHRG